MSLTGYYLYPVTQQMMDQWSILSLFLLIILNINKPCCDVSHEHVTSSHNCIVAVNYFVLTGHHTLSVQTVVAGYMKISQVILYCQYFEWLWDKIEVIKVFCLIDEVFQN